MPLNSKIIQATSDGVEDIDKGPSYAHMEVPILTHINSTFLPSIGMSNQRDHEYRNKQDKSDWLSRVKQAFTDARRSRPSFHISRTSTQRNSPNGKTRETLEETHIHQTQTSKVEESSNNGNIKPNERDSGFLPVEEEQPKTTPFPKMRSHKKKIKPIAASFDINLNI